MFLISQISLLFLFDISLCISSLSTRFNLEIRFFFHRWGTRDCQYHWDRGLITPVHYVVNCFMLTWYSRCVSRLYLYDHTVMFNKWVYRKRICNVYGKRCYHTQGISESSNPLFIFHPHHKHYFDDTWNKPKFKFWNTFIFNLKFRYSWHFKTKL